MLLHAVPNLVVPKELGCWLAHGDAEEAGSGVALPLELCLGRIHCLFQTNGDEVELRAGNWSQRLRAQCNRVGASTNSGTAAVTCGLARAAVASGGLQKMPPGADTPEGLVGRLLGCWFTAREPGGTAPP